MAITETSLKGFNSVSLDEIRAQTLSSLIFGRAGVHLVEQSTLNF